MLAPKIYVKDKGKVYDVEEIHFDINVVAYNDGVHFDYAEVDFDEVEFMDNTGMKDKNGNYIYVGDIVKVNDSWKCRVEYRQKSCEYILKAIDIKWSLSPHYYFGNVKTIEVIGNIYENKELLAC